MTFDPPPWAQLARRDFTMEECTEVGVGLLATLPADVPVVFSARRGAMIARRASGRVTGMVLFITTAESSDFRTRATSRLLTLLLAIPLLDRVVDRMPLSVQLTDQARQSHS